MIEGGSACTDGGDIVTLAADIDMGCACAPQAGDQRILIVEAGPIGIGKNRLQLLLLEAGQNTCGTFASLNRAIIDDGKSLGTPETAEENCLLLAFPCRVRLRDGILPSVRVRAFRSAWVH